jgi:hypothetical protein
VLDQSDERVVVENSSVTAPKFRQCCHFNQHAIQFVLIHRQYDVTADFSVCFVINSLMDAFIEITGVGFGTLHTAVSATVMFSQLSVVDIIRGVITLSGPGSEFPLSCPREMLRKLFLALSNLEAFPIQQLFLYLSLLRNPMPFFLQQFF